MNTVMLWLGCFLTAAGLSAADSREVVEGYSLPDASLSIVLEDRANVGTKALYTAENLASAILARAEVRIHWTTRLSSDRDLLLTDFRKQTGEICGVPLGSSGIRAVILPRAPRGLPPRALGFASPCAREGNQVTVYADRVELVSHSSSGSFHRVLAYALAHEVGHVLLRSGAHDSGGLMKGTWGKNDWQRAAVELIPFTPEEEAWIRHEFSQAVPNNHAMNTAR